MMDEESESLGPARPRTISVLGLLIVVAAIFSYLGAFAVTNALVSADLLDRWPPGHDPRPRWMMMSFGSMTGAFVLLSALFRISNGRQMKRLDAIADDTA